MKPTTLTAIVRDRTGVLFEDSVKAISSKNEKGVFDVLPGHANFLSLITQEVYLHLHTGEKRTFQLSRGMVSVIDDTVTILLGITPEKTQ